MMKETKVLIETCRLIIHRVLNRVSASPREFLGEDIGMLDAYFCSMIVNLILTLI